MSRLRTHVFPLVGQRPIAELDTHDLLEITWRIKEPGAMDVALRVQKYLSTIMRGAKRARQTSQNPALDLEGSIHAPRTVHRPLLLLNRLPETFSQIDNYNGRELTKLAVLLTPHVFVRSSKLHFARWDEFNGLCGKSPTHASQSTACATHSWHQDERRHTAGAALFPSHRDPRTITRLESIFRAGVAR